MKIKCPWLGCSGIIDITEQVEGVYKGKGAAEIPWSTTTLVCPKCNNPVGSFDIDPGYWITINDKEEEEKMTIHNPRNKKSITLPQIKEEEKYKVLNKYLKEWARNKQNL